METRPDTVAFARVTTITAGREVTADYEDDDQAVQAALASADVVRVVLTGGRVLDRAGLDRLGPAAMEPQ